MVITIDRPRDPKADMLTRHIEYFNWVHDSNVVENCQIARFAEAEGIEFFTEDYTDKAVIRDLQDFQQICMACVSLDMLMGQMEDKTEPATHIDIVKPEGKGWVEYQLTCTAHPETWTHSVPVFIEDVDSRMRAATMLMSSLRMHKVVQHS